MPGSIPGPMKPRPAGSLKAAVAELVTAAGGLERCAELTGRSTTQLFRYTNPESPDQMPVNVIMALEAIAARPIVTAFLAQALDHVLLPVLPAAAAGDVLPGTATLAAEHSDFFAKLAADLADGRIDPREAGRLADEAFEVVQAGMTVIAGLRALRDQAPPLPGMRLVREGM